MGSVERVELWVCRFYEEDDYFLTFCCRYLPESLEWSMDLDGTEGVVRLKEPKAFSNRDKTIEGSAVSFEWKATMTSFFNAMIESK